MNSISFIQYKHKHKNDHSQLHSRLSRALHSHTFSVTQLPTSFAHNHDRPLPLDRGARLRFVCASPSRPHISATDKQTIGAAPAAAADGTDDLLDGGGDSTSDFLSRERAALGDDADQFASANDDAGDLLGGGGGANGTSQEQRQFQQNYPAVDGRNEVRTSLASMTVRF